MSGTQAHSLDAIEITEFLEDQQTGVLSLANEDDSYAIPVSFAYDDGNGGPAAMYFRLGYAPASQKEAFVETTDNATFVVYDQLDDGWHSVVAQGQLEQRSKNELDTAVVEVINDLDIPFFEVHERPADEIEFRIVRLRISTLHGIRAA